MIHTLIAQLIGYGLDTQLIHPDDTVYLTNALLEALHLDDYHQPELVDARPLEDILSDLLDYAIDHQLIQDDSTSRDLFDTKLMGLLTPAPSKVRHIFEWKAKKDPVAATDWYYKLSQDSDYIRRYRIAKDIRWITTTEYGDLDITINLSKPEKDPKAIAAAKLAPQGGYPKCLLCHQNEGYSGRMNHPARQNHRLVPLTIDGQDWFLQYSPYVYYNEHCICLSSQHSPMAINKSTFVKLLDFVAQFPHYFVGSNADLPIVGGSILSHDHFQGGHYSFAMEKAPIGQPVQFQGFEDVTAGMVKWPMSVLRIACADRNRLVELADNILTAWRGYTDQEAMVLAETEGEPHNTITPIARFREGKFELDLALRNNLTSEEHPLGIYHPHAELHHIKKENIGLIEVMGLAILPARLKTELADLAQLLVTGGDIRKDESLSKHADWAEALAQVHQFTEENVHGILQDEVGKVFAQVLEHAGVYKWDEAGRANFQKFVDFVNQA